jgi:hypothetical protein
MNSKTKALTLLSIVLVAVVAGSFIFAMQAVKADTTTPVATDSETTPSVVNASRIGFNGFYNGTIAFGMTRFGISHRIDRGFGGLGAVQVSSDFKANVTNVVKNDGDVQNLLNQGYKITFIQPIISTVVDVNGDFVAKASTVNVLLQGNNGSRSIVVVDLTQDKVTKIVALTVTEIDK